MRASRVVCGAWIDCSGRTEDADRGIVGRVKAFEELDRESGIGARDDDEEGASEDEAISRCGGAASILCRGVGVAWASGDVLNRTFED